MRILLACLIMITSCALSGESPGEKDLPWGEPLEGIRISLVFDAETCAPLDPVKCRIAIQNVAQEDLLFFMNGIPFSNRDSSFHVVGPGDRIIETTNYGKHLCDINDISFGRPQIKLKHNELVMVDVLAFNRAFDLSRAGKYKVFLKVKFPSRKGDGKTIEVTSNVAEITIADPEGYQFYKNSQVKAEK